MSGDLAAALLGWGERERRDLPWRRTRDPWSVLVSELMLQQTQVSRVVPRYERFLARFPSAESCADGSLGEVIQLWEGLGYNRRARHLHQAAGAVVARHGGALPATVAELEDLPGVGRYTARAVLAFAFEADVGVVDTNAARVLARAVAGRSLRPSEVQALADEMVPVRRGWAWNQAMLDLGALVCVKRTPRCGDCPIAEMCAFHGAGPDPAEGSAGTGGKQSAFAGSDRQGRGRLVDALRRGPVLAEDLASVLGWPGSEQRALRVAERLVAEGMIVRRSDGALSLP